MLRRVIYVSDAVGTAGISTLSIAQILGESDRNNRRDHITGVLMFHNGQFLQALEGAQVDIDRLWQRLGADPRHCNLRILVNEPIAERRFGDWSMGQCRPLPQVVEAANDRDLSALDPWQAQDMLERAVISVDAA